MYRLIGARKEVRSRPLLLSFILTPPLFRDAQATPSTPTPAPAASTATTPAAAPSSTTATPSTGAATGNYDSAASTLVSNDAFEAMVTQIMDMGFPREQVIAALNASFRNPDRAVQFLLSVRRTKTICVCVDLTDLITHREPFQKKNPASLLLALLHQAQVVLHHCSTQLRIFCLELPQLQEVTLISFAITHNSEHSASSFKRTQICYSPFCNNLLLQTPRYCKLFKSTKKSSSDSFKNPSKETPWKE